MEVLSQIRSTINNWWIYLITGVLFVLGAFYVFSTPEASYLTLSIFFAIFILIDGVSSISLSLSNKDKMKGWGWQLASGIIAVVIGFSLFIHPDLSMAILPLYIGFWVLMKGGLIIGTSFDLKSHGIGNWGWVFFLGIVNTIMGLMMIINPVFGASMILIFTAISLLTVGISMIAISLWLKKVKVKVKELKVNASNKLDELKKSVEDYITNHPDDVKAALTHIKGKLDEAMAEKE